MANMTNELIITEFVILHLKTFSEKRERLRKKMKKDNSLKSS
jgi:hypothetical protein